MARRLVKRLLKSLIAISTSAYLLANLALIVYWSSSNLSKRSLPFISSWSPKTDEPDSHRIYFHGARGRDKFALSRQSCAVESTARHNPGRSVQLFISTKELNEIPLSYSTDPWLAVLERYDNVAIILYDESEYFAGTPLERAYHEGLWRKGPDHHVHMSDHLRMVSSFRAGGLYMDVDVVTLKPLDERIFWNFFTVQDSKSKDLCTCIFHLEHGHRLIRDLMDQLALVQYDRTKYLAYGPELVRSFLVDRCGLQMPNLLSTISQCQDVKVLPHHYFFPISWEDWELYFEELNEDDEETATLVENSYGLHVWNNLSRNDSLSITDPKILYNVIAAQHCPLTTNATKYTLK